MGSTHSSATAHALYRLYGDTGQLLYVGISNDPGRRFGQHASTKSWWQAVRGISLDWYSSREDALAAETRAIRVERPLANVVRPAMPATVPPRCGHCLACKGGDDYCLMYCELDEDEDRIVDTCDTCGRRDCLYVLGYDTGSQHGWSSAWDAVSKRFREAQGDFDG